MRLLVRTDSLHSFDTLPHNRQLQTVLCCVGRYMFAELFLWHDPGHVQDISKGLESVQHFEHVDTKRRLNNIVHVSGLHDKASEFCPLHFYSC